VANFQAYPQSIFPISGDLSTPIGASSATVVGIQGTGVLSTTPLTNQVLMLLAGNWTPTYLDAILVNSGASGCGQTKQVFINGVSDGASSWGIDINGSPDGG
jgi:hypothetical protein